MSKGPEATWQAKEGVRWIVGLIFVAAVVIAAGVGLPGEGSDADLPAIALGQPSLYRLEVFLVVFYGGLLVATPLFRGLVGGKLPIEVSARGAKYAEEAAESIEETKKQMDALRLRMRNAESAVARTRLNVDQLADETSTELLD